MLETQKVNILLVGEHELVKELSALLAEKLDMFFVDCLDFIDYDLIDKQDMIEKCGEKYFKKRERGVIEGCRDYQNTVLSITTEKFQEYQTSFTNSFVIVLHKKGKSYPRKNVDKHIAISNETNIELLEKIIQSLY